MPLLRKEDVIEGKITMNRSPRKRDGEVNDAHTMAADSQDTGATFTTASTDGMKLNRDVEENSVITFEPDEYSSAIFRTPPVSSRSLDDTDEFASAPLTLASSSRKGPGSVQSSAISKSSLRRHSSNDSPLLSPSRNSLRKGGMGSQMKFVESERSDRVKEVMEELTINKLNIKSLGLVGREQEKSLLESCFQKLCPPTTYGNDSNEEPNRPVQNQLVFIKGYSGIGKSVLARTLQKDIGASGVFVEGKYEFTSTDEPYSGVAQAFGKLCNEFEDCGEETVAHIASAIKENMREEALMLTSLIPEISILLDDEDLDSASVQSGPISAGREHERWKFAFRTFTRILGSYFTPIVMVLDDLQWADISSLDILDYLVSDVQNPNPLMIIGCFRSNEVDENSILYNRIQTLHGKSTKGAFQVTEIELQSCTLDSVNKIIMSLMGIDDESKTRDLAEVCYKRTLGNPFFLIEFMRMLDAEDLIEFNLGSLKWVWDVAKIENATMSTDNAVDLLKSRMRKLPYDVQLLLQYAACLGSSFSVAILDFVWSEHAMQKLGGENGDVPSMLKAIQGIQLVERFGYDELRWVHDKVQEAALSLSELVTPSFQFGLGMCLYHGLASTELDTQLFDVADLVNKGDRTGAIDVALLNLRAAKKARKMAALQSVSTYAAYGIEQLPDDDKWTLHRQMTLQLYSLGAEMEYALGNIRKAEEYIGIILDRDEFTPMETLLLKKMKAQILATAHLRWNEACDYGLVILKDLGYNFAWNRNLIPVQMLVAIRNLAKRVKMVSVEDAKNMRAIQNKKQNAVIDILKMMKHLTYSANDLPLCFLCVCKVIEMTLDHGIGLGSADCFATFGGVLMFLYKDHAAASHVCDLAFALQKRSGRRYIADTMHSTWAFVLVHMRPLHEGLNLTMEGYTQGLRDGDPLDSTNCLINRFVLLPYMMGRPLDTIIKEFPKIAPQLEESGITNNILTLKVWWQMMLNLRMPPSEESKKLEGEEFRQSEEKADSNMYVGNVNLAIGELLLFFGEDEERANRLLGEEKGKTYSELVQGYPPHGIETFHRGIAWFTMARKTGKRGHKSRAIKIRKEVAKWAEKGNPNAKDYNLFLTAEEAALHKKYQKADALYKQAIVHVCRIGHLFHAALYNERYAKYRLDVHGDDDDCKYHMGESIRYYAEWGALGKADQLRQEFL
ncbi:unnamed protein product [Cylindrotheca closterium]|uniref:Orc1-like AAA ATPase domain-containing protein n=1 Tax=Cylindrotheca closterium TaxID=2856 RepID=A0AAD2G398_9STRA|nr:unnamed protein product [Cylindrotheca closterium]